MRLEGELECGGRAIANLRNRGIAIRAPYANRDPLSAPLKLPGIRRPKKFVRRRRLRSWSGARACQRWTFRASKQFLVALFRLPEKYLTRFIAEVVGTLPPAAHRSQARFPDSALLPGIRKAKVVAR